MRPTHAPSAAATLRLDREILTLLWPYLREHWLRIAFSIVLLVAAKAATVAVPLVLQQVVDALEGAPAVVLPLGLLLGYGALRLSASLFRELQSVVFARASL